MSPPKVAIIIYPSPHQLVKLAEAVRAGILDHHGHADIFLVEPVAAGHAPLPYPVLDPNDLKNFDAFLLGFPSYFGSYPAGFKTFWDATIGLWEPPLLAGKYAGFFVSTGNLGGGQEVCVLNSISLLAHHGIIYVPLGYGHVYNELTNVNEVHGATPWGAGVVVGPDVKREPSLLELEVARRQGAWFWRVVSRCNF